MDPFVEMLLWTALAGACIPIGAGLGHIEHIRSRWLEEEFRHFVIAFGGGVLVGAVALVLVPEGVERLPQPLAVAGLMLAGGGAFMMIDRLQAKGKQAAPQFTAMAADFLPESLALGGMFAANPEGGVLLALLIGLQNLPEGFNAWQELDRGPLKRTKVLGLMGAACLARPRVWPDRLVLARRSGRRPGGDHAVRIRWHSLSHVPGHRAAGAAGAALGAAARRRAGIRARAAGRDAVPLVSRFRSSHDFALGMRSHRSATLAVMPGLVPGIPIGHARRGGVDGRDKPGHDGREERHRIMRTIRSGH